MRVLKVIDHKKILNSNQTEIEIEQSRSVRQYVVEIPIKTLPLKNKNIKAADIGISDLPQLNITVLPHPTAKSITGSSRLQTIDRVLALPHG
jgi:hypothetical protein